MSASRPWHRRLRWPVIVLTTVLAVYVLTLFGPASDALVAMVTRVHPVPAITTTARGTLLTAADGSRLQLVNPDRVRVMPMDVRPDHRNIRLFLRYEDEAFFRHRGVDARAIARSLYHSATHCRPHHCHIVSGASTITMQLVKLLHPRPRTWTNKAIEAIEARQLERQHDKATILAAYLNRLAMPEGMRGINTGAMRYFGKDFYQLALHELALLSAMPQAPARMDPIEHADNALRQRNKLLARWLAYGEITPEEHAEAAARPLGAARYPFAFAAPHYGFRLALRSEHRASHVLPTQVDPILQATMAADLLAAADAHGLTASAAVFDRRVGEFVAYQGSHRYTDREHHGNEDQLFRKLLPCRLVTAALIDATTTCQDRTAITGLRDLSLSLREPLTGSALNAAQLLRTLAASGKPLTCPAAFARASAVCEQRPLAGGEQIRIRARTYVALLMRQGERSGVFLLTQPWTATCLDCPGDEIALADLEATLARWLLFSPDTAVANAAP